MEKQKLIEKRKERGFSEQELAERVSMTQSTYSRKEKGTAPIFSEEWERIAKALNVDKNEIEEENTNSVIFSNSNFKTKYNGYYIIANQSEKIIEQFEKRLDEKDKEIAFLRELLKQKNEVS